MQLDYLMNQADFHGCLTAFAQQENEVQILSLNGIIKIMYFPFDSKIRYDSDNDILDKEWKELRLGLLVCNQRHPQKSARHTFRHTITGGQV